jgi:hypothetical protein
LQRYFWLSWYGMGENEEMLSKYWRLCFFARVAYVVAFVCVQTLFLLLVVAYHYEGTPYSAGNYYLFALYFVYLTGLPWLLKEDLRLRFSKGGLPGELTLMQAGVIFTTALANAAMTWVTVVDLNYQTMDLNAYTVIVNA